MCEGVIVYIFGYGSLIWRPGFPFLRKFDGYIKGWTRYFWQGSTDHRGTPEEPGRVVTLVKDPQGETWGTVYCVPDEGADVILRNLDYREKGGYTREEVDIFIRGQEEPVVKKAILYIATHKNNNFIGEAPLDLIARQIYKCVGPSGPNVDYLLNLAENMRRMNVMDEHVFELEKLVLNYISTNRLPHHTHPSLTSYSMTSETVNISNSEDNNSNKDGASIRINTSTTTTITIDSSSFTSTTSEVDIEPITPVSEAQNSMQRRYFLAPNAIIKGTIYIDDGAVMAVSQRGRSLLAAGIVNVKGDFKPQDLISIVNQSGAEISRGITFYGSEEISKIQGEHSSKISSILGFSRGEVVVHHHNMILV